MPSTGWLTTFRDATNQLVITDGDLLDENPPEFGSNIYGISPPDWFAQIIDKSAPGRRANYRFIEDLIDGPPVATSLTCAIRHARNGERQNGVTWEGECAGLEGGLAASFNNPTTSARFEGYAVGGGGIPPSLAVREDLRARGLFAGVARDHLAERGVLSFALADPVADGVPEAFADEAVFEWEPGGELELTKVEVTGDTLGRPASGAGTTGATFALNDAVHPGYHNGVWETEDPSNPGSYVRAWLLGFHAVDPDGSGRPHVIFTYVDGGPVWYELTHITSWDDCQPVSGSLTDATIGIELSDEFNEASPSLDLSTTYDIAVRLTFRSPRYRWTWGLSVTPPRRIFQRSDAMTHGARRVLGGGNTVQAGNRALGGIL